MSAPYLTDEHIAHLTQPLTQPAAQANALRAMGFRVIVRPDGRPVVSVANFEQVTSIPNLGTIVPKLGTDLAQAPDEARFLERRNGKKAKG